ncbi:prepilin-type N-terminal cleavage/methylation domain-containing protein [Clostridium beijerinckii]|uniref:prepilin-type N-terminal cleavage/methylation domain-containing protein n=1 Tax=Clostridium beijerinckii TaxID=1520 RepID=UPI00156E14A5
MKRNFQKYEGFTLLEVIISMALISIISVGVYNAYLLLIKQTKDAQVKQTAALKGKNVIEEIKVATKNGEFHILEDKLNVGSINFEQSAGGSVAVYKRYLDENYNECSESLSKYVETITLNKTQASIGGKSIEVKSAGGIGNAGSSGDNVETFDYSVFVKNNNGSIEIGRVDDESGDLGTSPAEIKSDKDIKLFVYTSWDSSKKQKKIIIKDEDGKQLIGRVFSNIDGIEGAKKQIKFTVNFKDYVLDKSKNIQINLYNKDDEPINICLEKSSDLNVDIETRQGEVNVYNNRSEEETQIGDLHDIKVQVAYTNGGDLFTGYFNENLDVENP